MTNFPITPLRIAIAQLTPKDGDIAGNVSIVTSMIKQAEKEKTDLIVFPEKFLTGYVPELIEKDTDVHTFQPNDKRLEPIRRCCKENHMYAIIGAPTQNQQKLYVSSIVINPKGEEQLIYNKTHLYPTETQLFQSDDKQAILEIKGWKIGIGICYDSNFPKHAEHLAKAGCQVYLVSALFSKGNGYLESRTWFPARAKDNFIFTVMCNFIGKTGAWDTCGSSAVWNPKGDIISEASAEKSELLVVDLKG